MRVAIVGSRDYRHTYRIMAYIDTLPLDTVIVSGGARGVDSIAERHAQRRGLKTLIFPAKWSVYGKQAGHIRNKLIIDNADKVVAFWDGASPGTKNTIAQARFKHMPVEIVGDEE